MRLKLTVERQGLPPVQLLWSTTALASTSNPPPSSVSLSLSTAFPSGNSSSSLTVAQLLDQVNAVVPLESQDWGLEDYVLDLGGYECLHFARVHDILKEDDVVVVRPLQTQEVRLRALGGRVQVSRDGRHLFDGVGWGRPFVRRTPRPDVRIQPRRFAAHYPQDYDDGAEHDDEDDDKGVLMLPTAPVHTEHPSSKHSAVNPPPRQASDASELRHRACSPPQGHYGSVRLGKRRLDSPFQPSIGNKRARSAQYVSATGDVPLRIGNSSTSNKSVRFDDTSDRGGLDVTSAPVTLDDVPTDSDEDDDYHPRTDDQSNSESYSDSDDSDDEEEDKENHPPRNSNDRFEDSSPRSRATAESMAVNLGTVGLSSRGALTEVATKSPTSSESDVSSESEVVSDNMGIIEGGQGVSSSETDATSDASDSTSDSEDFESGDSEDEVDTADDSGSSSESESESDSDTSDSNTSGTSEILRRSKDEKRSSQVVHQVLQDSEGPKATVIPPGQGKMSTKRRNRRKRLSARLASLKSMGVLPKNASLADCQAYLDDLRAKGKSPVTHDFEFQTRRQQLLKAIETGGVNVGDAEPTKIEVEAEEFGHLHSSHTDRPAADNSAKERVPGVDKNAVRRVLFQSLGVRAPTTKIEEERLRKKSRASAAKENSKFQRRSEAQQEILREAERPVQGIAIDEDWQDHTVLKAVECLDPSIEYSTPPFPFEQRWDPAQASSLWRQNKGKRHKRNHQNQRLAAEAEERFDATMYDDPKEASMTQAANDQMPERSRHDDFAASIDLVPENALQGARIAFKTLHLSEETGWTPMMSDYKVATITDVNRDDGTLLLRLDDEYRPVKRVDPETGERIFSNFVVEAMEEDADDSIIATSFSELNSPKLLEAAPVIRSIQDASSDHGMLSGLSITQRSADEKKTGAQERSFTAPYTSFGASTQTLVSDTSHAAPQPSVIPSSAADSMGDQEVSLLIKEAGFRSSVDPEAERPLQKALGADEVIDQSLNSSTSRPKQTNTEAKGLKGLHAGYKLDVTDGSGPRTFPAALDGSTSSPALVSTAAVADDCGQSRSAEYPPQSAVAIDAPYTADNESGRQLPRPPPKTDGVAETRQMMSGALHPTSPSHEPFVSAEELLPNEEMPTNLATEDEASAEDDDSQSSFPSLDSLLADSQRAIQKKRSSTQVTEASELPRRTAGRRNTRLNARRASAMANPITLSDDEANEAAERQTASSPMVTSTAPASFTAINSIKAFADPSQPASPAPKESSSAVTKDNTIDLTEYSDIERSSDEDDVIDETSPPPRRSSGRKFDSSHHSQFAKRPTLAGGLASSAGVVRSRSDI